MKRTASPALAALLTALLLAGCAETAPGEGALPPDPNADPDDGIEPAPGVAPQEGRAEGTNGDLHLTITLDPDCEDAFCLDALAENEGLDTYHVSSICAPAFSDSMERGGKPVQHRQSMAYCAAFGTEPMGPNESREARLTWDARVWDEEGAAAPAPDGAYQWTVTFEAHEEPDGGGRTTVQATVTVVVGET